MLNYILVPAIAVVCIAIIRAGYKMSKTDDSDDFYGPTIDDDDIY
jgi:hypothetical protein